MARQSHLRDQSVATPPFTLRPFATALALCSVLNVSWAAPLAPIQALPPAAASLQQAYPVYPVTSINGAAQDAVIGFFALGDTLYANHAALVKLGIRLDEQECQASGTYNIAGLPQSYFPLSECTMLQHTYLSGRQRLEIVAPLGRLDLAVTRFGATQVGPPQLSRPDFSTVLNYDASISGSSNASNSKGLYTQWRFGTPWGYFESNHVQTNTQGRTEHQRLDTYWRSVWPEQGLALTVGDTYSSQLTGSSGARMGGLQLSSSYNTRPWYQKVPQTLFTGSSELPSAVDLYLNGVKQYSQNVNAGPYELNLPPTLSQAGTAQIVTRDALGRQTVVDVPLYDSAELLAPGLQEWSVEAGALRLAQSTGQQYDNHPLISGTWRRGVNNRLTMQLHGEAKKGYEQAGIGLRGSASFPTQLGGQISVSQYQGKRGHQVNVFSTYQGQNWSMAAGGNQASAGFATLSSTLNTTTPFAGTGSSRKQAYVQGGWSNQRLGSFSLGRIWSRQVADRQDVWTASWSKQISPLVSLMAALSLDERNPQQRSAMFGLNIQLDKNTSSSAYATRQQGNTGINTQVQKGTDGVGSLGWNLGWQDDENHQQSAATAGLQAITQYGDGSAQLRRGKAGAQSWQANWRGGVVLLNGKVAPTRTVYDSFAVVSTNGAAGVPVKVQNNLVGNTDASGKIFVPGLIAYQHNQVSIDSAMLPANQRIASSRQTMVPYEKAGSSVSFDVQTINAWMLSLIDENGQPLGMGASVLDAAGIPLTVVGFEGRVYVESEPAAETGARTFLVISNTAAKGTQECRFSLTLAAQPKVGENVQDFGVVTCHP